MEPSLLEMVLGVARRASAEVLEIYRSGDFDVALKGDESPLTRADLASQRLIIAELTANSPYPVVAEESPVEFEVRKAWKRYWLVDPLDGTKDFIARNDEFTINIASIEDGRPVLGVVALPAQATFYYAEAGKGAFKDAGGTTQRISSRSGRTELICADSRFHASPHTEAFCRRLGITRVAKIGSAIKLCKIAEGEIDIYPRFVGTKEWDTAAGHCILNESECCLLEMETRQEMTYNKPSLTNPSFLAGRRELLERLQPVFLTASVRNAKRACF